MVVFMCKNDDQKALQKVYYILKLCSNIISLRKVTEDGNKLQMMGDVMKVPNRSGKLLMSMKRTQNCLYKITLKTFKQVCFLTSLKDPTWLCYARISHVKFYDLKLMREKKIGSWNTTSDSRTNYVKHAGLPNKCDYLLCVNQTIERISRYNFFMLIFADQFHHVHLLATSIFY